MAGLTCEAFVELRDSIMKAVYGVGNEKISGVVTSEKEKPGAKPARRVHLPKSADSGDESCRLSTQL